MKHLIFSLFAFSFLIFGNSCQDAVGSPMEASGNAPQSVTTSTQPAAQKAPPDVAPTSVAEVKDVDAAGFKSLIDQSHGIVVDIRTPREFQQGHIPNAINIPWGWSGFDGTINDLDKSRPYLIYCLSGARSGRAKSAMKDMGFQEVVNLQHGLKSWYGAGYEIVR